MLKMSVFACCHNLSLYSSNHWLLAVVDHYCISSALSLLNVAF